MPVINFDHYIRPVYKYSTGKISSGDDQWNSLKLGLLIDIDVFSSHEPHKVGLWYRPL